MKFSKGQLIVVPLFLVMILLFSWISFKGSFIKHLSVFNTVTVLPSFNISKQSPFVKAVSPTADRSTKSVTSDPTKTVTSSGVQQNDSLTNLLSPEVPYTHVPGMNAMKTQSTTATPSALNKSDRHTTQYVKNVFKEKDKVVLLHNLCMEPDIAGMKLVAYNASRNGSLNIAVKAGPHYLLGKDTKWRIELSTLPLPNKQNYTYSHAAYYVSTTCEGNFHHFWIDTVSGLFGSMKATNTLGSKIPSQLYYSDDVWSKTASGCNSPRRYQDILYALPVKMDHVYYKHARPHSCYDNAIFGNYNKGYSLKEKRKYFMEAFNITCQDSKRTRVTIINRKTRRILNADEMQRAADNAGFEAQVIDLADLSLREQFAVVMCTDVLVGLQGAGLRWIDFLPPRSALLELVWTHWGSFYVSQASGQGKKTAVLHAKTVQLNLPVYFKIVHKSSPKITKELLAKYYKKGPVTESDNHWKYAEGTFDPKAFVDKLKSIKP